MEASLDQVKTCWRLIDRKRAFDLYKLTDDFCSWFARALDLRDCSLSTQICAELPRYFQGNILMLGFLLWDVARYSLAYAGSGEARLEIDSRPLKASRYSICFILTMPGSGIPLEKEKLLFLPVRPSKKRAGGRHASSNLYYASLIAGLFDGLLRVQNDIGSGTEYSIETCLSADLTER